MFENDLLKYFRSSSTLVAEIGDKDRIVIGNVVPSDKLPWLAIEIGGGTRSKISQSLTEQSSTIRVIVTAGPNQQVKGKSIAEMALRLLENYRGNIYSTNDVYITCSAINMINGLASVVRYQFTASIRFTEAYAEPV